MNSHQTVADRCRQLLVEQDIVNRWQECGLTVDYGELTALLIAHLGSDPPDMLENMAANLARDYPLVRQLSRRTGCRYDLYVYFQKVAYGKFRDLPPGLTTDDIVQETMLRVLAKLDSYGYRSRFRTWCTTILIRTGCEMLRKEQRRHFFEGTSTDAPVGEEGLNLYEILDGKARNPEQEYMIYHEFWELVDQALKNSRNRDRDKMIIVKRIYEVSGKEIAEEMSISRETVDMVMNRFKKRMKALLAETRDVGTG